MRSFLLARNRARFQEAAGEWLTRQAERADLVDAGRATAAELADALARARQREQQVLAAPLADLPDRVRLPSDLEAAAGAQRRALDDAFIAELVDREETLAAAAAGLHRRYAEVHAELDRVHREYALLWEDRKRLRELAAREQHA